MDSEKMLLTLYKKQEYETTQRKTQQMVLLIALISVVLSFFVALLILKVPILTYGLVGAFVLIIVSFILQHYKVVSLNTASVIYFSYFYFLFLPIYWYHTNGVSDTAPYISFVFPLVIFLVFSDKTRFRIQVGLMLTVIGMSIYSVITSTPELVVETAYKVLIYSAMMFLMNFYLLHLYKRYEKMHDEFLRGSIKDDLTLVLSRGALSVITEYVEKLYNSKNIDYVMIMIDVNNFKKLNDEYGHVVGDVVLRNTADCIRQNMRSEDFVIRYGGDEFLVILMDTTIDAAVTVLDRIEQARQCEQMMDFKISVSRGYAKRSECDNPEDLIILADKRMYENKNANK